MVQTKTLAWSMVIATIFFTIAFFASFFELGEIHKMLADSSFFILRSIIIICFFLFLGYTAKLLYALLTHKKLTENVFVGMLFLFFFFFTLKPLLIEILFGYDLFYCYAFDLGNCIEAIVMPLVRFFTLSLILLSSLFYLGVLQANKKIGFIAPTKEKIAKMQIVFGCLLFVGTLIWSLFILPSINDDIANSFNDYTNDSIEALLSENPHAQDTLTKDEITQDMISYTFSTMLSSTQYTASLISIIFFTLSIFFILQGLYNFSKD